MFLRILTALFLLQFVKCKDKDLNEKLLSILEDISSSDSDDAGLENSRAKMQGKIYKQKLLDEMSEEEKKDVKYFADILEAVKSLKRQQQSRRFFFSNDNVSRMKKVPRMKKDRDYNSEKKNKEERKKKKEEKKDKKKKDDLESKEKKEKDYYESNGKKQKAYDDYESDELRKIDPLSEQADALTEYDFFRLLLMKIRENEEYNADAEYFDDLYDEIRIRHNFNETYQKIARLKLASLSSFFFRAINKDNNNRV